MDRRVLWAIALMMVIAIAPTFLLKPPVKPAVPAADTTGRAVEPSAPTPPPSLTAGAPVEAPGAQPIETLTVSSPLYRYAVSTRGGALVQATMLKYQALNPEDRGTTARLLPEDTHLNQLALVVGNDTLSLADWDFTPAARRLGGSAARELTVEGEDTLRLSATRGAVSVNLEYRFRAGDYQIGVSGTAVGLGPVGGHLLVNMGHGLRQTEADSNANHYDFGIVTKTDESKLKKFSSLKPGERTTLDGPFEWAAVKAKYFVTALLMLDSDSSRISGVTALAHPPAGKMITTADVTFGVPVPVSGRFDYTLYVGPMEYPRLKAIGHDFYDINPYGWPGFRTMIRPVAVGARDLLVWMHEHLNLAYGVVLILFGIMIRILLWPLNQKGMRASLRMQALQPEMQRIQDKYKDDPTKLQQEVMGLYKREGVNPFSGCWPMLLPWPIMLALFFVLANSIELRGQPFLWLPDLSLKDPLYIIPVLMGLSMFGVNYVGMKGMPPSPQSKMMLYFLPLMMTVLFISFASGLNLYYFVQNVVSIPQQWSLAKERMKNRPPEVVVGKKK